MRRLIENTLLGLLSSRMERSAINVELKPKLELKPCVSLTEDEKEQVRKVWGGLDSNLCFDSWSFYKTHFSFNPLFVPDGIYVKSVVRTINPIRMVYCLQSKSVYPFLFSELHKPHVFANCINGICFDSENKVVKIEDVPAIVKGERIIVKPSANSCSGGGVMLFDMNETSAPDLVSQLQRMGKNFVCQECVRQSEATARFNKSSLNSFRLNTLNLNGRITCENIMFRHGRGDSVVDNAGAGGICVGFDNDGNVISKAIDAQVNKYDTTPWGELYMDVKIPSVNKLVEMAIWAHQRYLPMMGHAAWDLALDENDEPIFIEVNLGWPGVMTEQMSSARPIFMSRTEEIIDFVKENKHKMHFTDFMGNWT